jgi:hypothetical protein
MLASTVSLISNSNFDLKVYTNAVTHDEFLHHPHKNLCIRAKVKQCLWVLVVWSHCSGFNLSLFRAMKLSTDRPFINDPVSCNQIDTLYVNYIGIEPWSKEQYPLAFSCMDPATAPRRTLLVSEMGIRLVPAGLAGFAAVHPFWWFKKGLGRNRYWQWGHYCKVCSNAANTLQHDNIKITSNGVQLWASSKKTVIQHLHQWSSTWSSFQKT